MLDQLKRDLAKTQDPRKAKVYQRYFKTGKGEYGEGDIFLGITVPQERQVAKKYTDLTLGEIQKLLSAKIHEYRAVALIILVEKYRKADSRDQKKIFEFYLKNTKYVNNWDLVDGSAEYIIGVYLADKDRTVIYKLARSKNLWERRIAMLSTFHFIKNRQFEDSLMIAEILLDDTHDLIHKAVGWLLREIGKRDLMVEEKFLQKHYKIMPRTMLRYAIERFDPKKKNFYMGR